MPYSTVVRIPMLPFWLYASVSGQRWLLEVKI